VTELILEGRTLETPDSYAIGYDGDRFYIYRRGSVVATLSKGQTRTLVVEVMQRNAPQHRETP